MHIPKKIGLFFMALLVAASCDQSRMNMDVVIIPREVMNFEEVNSLHDDYNSAGPLYYSEEVFSLVFSTSRKSGGNNFDLVSYQCLINYDQVKLEIDIWPDPWSYPVVDGMNSSYNEWGPYLTFDILDHYFQGGEPPDSARLFFSSDREGDQDIYFCYYAPGGVLFPDSLPQGVNKLNTEYEEGYLCLHQETTDSEALASNMARVSDKALEPDKVLILNRALTTGREICYFTSNRDESFDIYSAIGKPNRRIETSDSLEISKVEIISSPSDDKCPYIVNNRMVFTSNREGGYGGFDLWYSVYNSGTWSAPENFGPGINTEYDEYRPVIIPTEPELFLNDLLIFSSNRPGGKGGFDLYYAGMDKRTGI